MNNIYFGYTTMTHGIHGELKLYTDFSRKDLVLKKDFPIYIGNEKHILTSARPHQNHYLITIDHLKDINLVESFRNVKIYIKKEDLKINDVLVEELLGFDVYENGILLGKVNELRYNNSGMLLEITGIHKFLLPYEKHFIKEIIPKEMKILVQNAKGLIL